MCEYPYHLNNAMLSSGSCEVQFAIGVAEFTESCGGLEKP